MPYCDHYCEAGDDRSPLLFPAGDAQPRALEAAGFDDVHVVHDEERMALYRATSR